MEKKKSTNKKDHAKRIMEKSKTSPKRVAKALKELPKKKVPFI